MRQQTRFVTTNDERTTMNELNRLYTEFARAPHVGAPTQDGHHVPTTNATA